MFTDVECQSVDTKYFACGVSFIAWEDGYIISMPESLRITVTENVLQSVSERKDSAQGSSVTVRGVLMEVHSEELRGGVRSRQVVMVDSSDVEQDGEVSRARVEVILWRSSVAEVTEEMLGACVTAHHFKVSEFGNRLQLSATRASRVSVHKDVDKKSVVELRSATTIGLAAASSFVVDARAAKPLSHWKTQKVDEYAPYVTCCSITLVNVHTYMACPECNKKRSDSILKDTGACPECHRQCPVVDKSYSEVLLSEGGDTINGKCFGSVSAAVFKMVDGVGKSAEVVASIRVEMLASSLAPLCTVDKVMLPPRVAQ